MRFNLVLNDYDETGLLARYQDIDVCPLAPNFYAAQINAVEFNRRERAQLRRGFLEEVH